VELFEAIRRDARRDGLSIRELARRHRCQPPLAGDGVLTGTL
jgi:hypothetical protein